MEETKQIVEQIYEYVRDQILSGAYQINTRISERVIGEHFGVSRTIVREAFHELKKKGWLYALGKSGTYVSKIDLQAIKENYEARIHLEPIVLLQAYPNMTEHDFLKMEKLCEDLEKADDTQYIVVETELHSILMKTTWNRYIIDLFEDMVEGMLRATSRSKSTSPRRQQSIQEWCLIVSNLKKKNPYMASQILEKHLINSYHNFLQNYEKEEKLHS